MAAPPLAEQYRAAWPRLLGALVRDFGRVELAEDCLQEAIARALCHDDLRDPVAWIAVAARRLMIDAARRETTAARKAPLLAPADDPPPDRSLMRVTTGDDRLDLLVLACQPSLPPASRMPLALRFVLGASTEEIADAFGVQHTAMSARLTRAKRALDSARPLTAPARGHREEVLHTISVLYTLGHTAVAGDALGDPAARSTAIELARAAVAGWADEPEASGLLAELLLTEARWPGRLGPEGVPSTLATADRTTWDRALIDEGLALATRVLPTAGRFALRAGIAGLHSSAESWERTDWVAIVALYDRLVERWPSPAALIARAVAVGYGPAGATAGLAALATVPAGDGATARQHAAAEADLLRRAERSHEARVAYLKARALERNSVARGLLEARLAELEA